MKREVFTAAGVVVAIAAAIAVAGTIFFVIDRPMRDNSGPEAARAEAAREAIADFEQAGNADYQQAFELAERFRREGRLADAQLLYFYAARGGHAESKFALAELNDPLYHSEETSLLSEPDPFQAYKWYSTALEGGVAPARARLEELHEWAKKAAADGDLEAERLLLQWP